MLMSAALLVCAAFRAGTFELSTMDRSAPIYGEPCVARFRGGCEAAFSLQFDDSMRSQAENALPLLAAHRIHATFFIIPKASWYAPLRRVWEVDVLKAGHELGNHTITHAGAKDAAQADEEIAQCNQVLDRLQPGPRIRPFARPGGVPWQVSDEEMARILDKHRLFDSTPERVFFADEWGGDIEAFPQRALRDHSWIQLGLHGVGGEWISTSVPNLTKLLTFLDTHRERLWTAVTGDVAKYIRERDAARLSLTDISESGFRLRLSLDSVKLAPLSPELYDQPLTVQIPVPASWERFTVKTKSGQTHHRIRRQGDRDFAQFDILPRDEEVWVTRSSVD